VSVLQAKRVILVHNTSRPMFKYGSYTDRHTGSPGSDVGVCVWLTGLSGAGK
jgi:hypothetical protein